MSELADTIESAMEVAEQRGALPMQFDEYHLMLDLDSDAAVQLFLDRYVKFCGDMAQHDRGVEKIWGWKSKSFHFHVVIKLKIDFSVLELCIMQSYLGSDTLRDFLTLQRLWKPELGERPRLLFKPKTSTIMQQKELFTQMRMSLIPSILELDIDVPF